MSEVPLYDPRAVRVVHFEQPQGLLEMKRYTRCTRMREVDNSFPPHTKNGPVNFISYSVLIKLFEKVNFPTKPATRCFNQK